MNAKAYLWRARDAAARVQELQQERQQCMSIATGIQATISESGVRAEQETSRVERAALALAEVDDRLADALVTYRSVISEASARIQQIPQERFRRVLVDRYICGFTWSQVKADMGYTGEKHVYKVHAWALAALDKILRGIE